MFIWDDFEKIWVVDFEFNGGSGDPPTPICYCSKEVYSGEEHRVWLTGSETAPKYATDDKSLFVAFFASAELGCHIPLHWNRPRNILDLYVEFRNETNGLSRAYLPAGRGLLGACVYYGIANGDATYKESMRDRILKGAPFTEEEKEQILSYCAKDVQLTSELFSIMKEGIDLQRALLRGRYMWSVAVMENHGVPLDMERYHKLTKNWERIKGRLIEKIDVNYGVYEGTTFKIQKFLDYLKKHEIPWDTTQTGLPRLDEDFLKEQAKSFPELKPLQELRYSLNQLKLYDLPIGHGGRNRTLLPPFGSLTGRNTPSSSKFIFGNAVWLRNLITPQKGYALAYLDYEQQEIGIAGALSGDENLITAYKSGDPYINFAIQAGALPENATKTTHPEIRERFKTCMLGINYGMTEHGFARRANIPLEKAKELYKMHRLIFRGYWDWIYAFMDEGKLLGAVTTRFGWKFRTMGVRERTLQNYPMQANGSDILRLAVCFCTENGMKIIAPIHDAVLIEAPVTKIEKDVETASWLMTEASRYVINFPLRVEARIIRHPDHYTDKRGDLMWKAIWEILNEPN